ncbi:Os01g0313050, partial [Oryza sativa Japonica Group]
GERSDERRVDVGGRLGVLVVAALVGELVLQVGPSDDGADEDVGVGDAGVERGEPLRAADPGGVRRHRRQRRRAVVDPPRVLGAVPDHVRHPHRVAPQQVVHLLARDGAEAGRRDGGAAAGDGGLGEGEVLGVGEQQEGAGGDVLHVAVAELEEEAAAGVLRLVRGGAGHHGADEAVGVALVLVQRRHLLHQERLGDQDPRPGVLVVPPERVVLLVRAQHLPVHLDVAQVRRVLGRPV